jgi:hypothetical protein
VLGEDRLAHMGEGAVSPSTSLPLDGNPPFGFPSGDPYGSPYGSPYARRDGLLTVDAIAEVCRETQAIAGLAFANWLLRMRPALPRSRATLTTSPGAVMFAFVGLLIVGVRQRAWIMPVHEMGLRRSSRVDVYPMVPGPPMSMSHSYEQLVRPARA